MALGYDIEFITHEVTTPEKILQYMIQHRPDLLIIDVGDEQFNFEEFGPLAKNDFPLTRIIVIIGDKNIRKSLKWLEFGADHLVYKGNFFLPDFSTVLENAIKKIEANKQRRKNIEHIFFPEQYPAALFQLQSHGPSVLLKDFEIIPNLDIDIPIPHLLDKLAIEYLILTGQGHTYHESCYILPAGSSKSHAVLVFSFRLDDPMAKDHRIRQGYFQLCLFVPNDFLPFLPPVSKLQEVIPLIKEMIPDSQTLSEESLVGIKYAILNHIRKIAEQNLIKFE